MISVTLHFLPSILSLRRTTTSVLYSQMELGSPVEMLHPLTSVAISPSLCPQFKLLFSSDGSISHVLNVTIIQANYSASVVCTSPKHAGICIIQHGQDSSYQELSPPIQIPFNVPIILPFIAPSTYYYLVTVTTNSLLTFQIRGNFSIRECEILKPTKPLSYLGHCFISCDNNT